MKIRTLIVDDEPLARLNLSSLLVDEPDFELVAECAEPQAAQRALAALRPDLVFVDVQMPGMNGFELVEGAVPPALVFVTAHEQYAARAFDARALDYLLKPFRRARFQQTLQRVRERLQPRHPAQRLLVRSGGSSLLVGFDEIEFVRAAANYVTLHLAGGACHDVREGIGVFEAQLPAERFVRIHRSYIVAVAALRSLDAAGGGEFVATLRSGRELPVGPSYPARVRQALLGAGVQVLEALKEPR
jgi:two-component system, LytTR family, response regulator